MAAALRWLPRADSLILMGPGDTQASNRVLPTLAGNLGVVFAQRDIQSVRVITPQVSSPDALMERMKVAAANELMATLVSAINPSASAPAWVPAPLPRAVINNDAARFGAHPARAELMALEQRLDTFAELMGVPRHEGSVRQHVYAALPAWAQERAQIDAIGNLTVEFGSEAGEATVFIAHMDEVGWEITQIAADGSLSLRSLGGVVTTAWEGQPAVLQIDPGAESTSSSAPSYLKGVFLQRPNPDTKRPEAVSAWFGMDANALAAAGVRVGMGITMLKEGHHMGDYRYASRSMDDRVGVMSLLSAINEIDPAQVSNRMIYAWSVQEEGGLRGAGELAKRYGDATRRAYSIDTFVSSQTPLESPHFAFAPLGSGPVLRSIENGSMATPYELTRNLAVADSMGIPYQIGHTQGGTDGTRFTFFGAPNAGLSWPGRYSHSPAEISDLRDIAGLVTLIKTMTLAPLELQ